MLFFLSLHMGSKLDPVCQVLYGPPAFSLLVHLGPRPTCACPCRSNTPAPPPPLDGGTSHSTSCTGQPHTDSHCRGLGEGGGEERAVLPLCCRPGSIKQKHWQKHSETHIHLEV